MLENQKQIVDKFNSVIIGSGISGLSLAKKLADAGHKVFVASKEAVTEAASKYAQGGIAVVSPNNPEDSLDSHIQDTLKSGKGLCNEEVVRELLSLSWQEVEKQIELGTEFDKSFNLEGSHSYKRIMHVGDATGRAVLKPLVDTCSRNLNISISQGTQAISLIKNSDKEIIGVRFVDITGEEFDIFADNVILATGGFAALYQDFTCPEILTGNGIALAYDAGAKVENLEFVQFHPTVLNTGKSNFLISEALRGAGAQLLNSQEQKFAHKYDKDAELATRDIVSRAIYAEMRATNAEHVYLDARALGKEFLESEFPNIYQTCLENGFDISKDLLPVRPAAHYCIGGIKTDINGRTNIPGLYALGEVASNGMHGANRLASNSLLECLVVPELLSQAILDDARDIDLLAGSEYCSDYSIPDDFESFETYKKELEEIRGVLTKNLAVERRQKSIQSTIKYLENFEHLIEAKVAILLAKSALQRKESRGVHFRVDAPKLSKSFERSTILSKDAVARRVLAIPA